MAKFYKVEAYVLQLNGTPSSKEELTQELRNNRYLDINVQDIQETDIGEWDDDHELNKRGANYRKFFPDSFPGPEDACLKSEYQRVRGIMLQQIDRNAILERENRKLIAEIEKLKKVQEFVKGIKDIVG